MKHWACSPEPVSCCLRSVALGLPPHTAEGPEHEAWGQRAPAGGETWRRRGLGTVLGGGGGGGGGQDPKSGKPRHESKRPDITPSVSTLTRQRW